MKSIISHIKEVIEQTIIICSILFYFILIVVTVQTNSIAYDYSYHSYSIFHDSFIEQERTPTIRIDNAVYAQDVNIH